MPGIADDTLFTMTCADWIEWNVTSQNLKYEYRIASYGSDRYARVPESLKIQYVMYMYMSVAQPRN